LSAQKCHDRWRRRDAGDPPNLIGGLRRVQPLLKREDIFADFQAREIRGLNLSLRREAGRALYHQELLLHLHIAPGGGARSISRPRISIRCCALAALAADPAPTARPSARTCSAAWRSRRSPGSSGASGARSPRSRRSGSSSTR
jgi:hypothetical protein